MVLQNRLTYHKSCNQFVRWTLSLPLTIILTFLAVSAQGQTTTDTTKVHKLETWDNFVFGPRVTCGIQKSFFTEFGLSIQRFFVRDKPATLASSTYYTSFEWTPTTSDNKKKNIYGIKGGYEWMYNGFVIGLEIKYQTNTDKEDIVFTPMIGIGVGTLNLMYGYNISTKEYPFSNIGKSQFSIVFNSNVLFKRKK